VDRIAFVHPVIALLDIYERELERSRARSWLDEYHFFLGDFFASYNNSAKALHHFQAVKPGSRRYPAAQYLFWGGLAFPAGTPRAIIDKLHDETRKALSLPAVQERLEALFTGHAAWASAKFGMRVPEHPSAAYIVLHTLSHALISAIALDCGYPASSQGACLCPC
jgi:hypothetical protein